MLMQALESRRLLSATLVNSGDWLFITGTSAAEQIVTGGAGGDTVSYEKWDTDRFVVANGTDWSGYWPPEGRASRPAPSGSRCSN